MREQLKLGKKIGNANRTEDARRSSSARDLVGRLAVSSTAAITASASASAYLTRAKLTLAHRAWQI